MINSKKNIFKRLKTDRGKGYIFVIYIHSNTPHTTYTEIEIYRHQRNSIKCFVPMKITLKNSSDKTEKY